LNFSSSFSSVKIFFCFILNFPKSNIANHKFSPYSASSVPKKFDGEDNDKGNIEAI